jgi:antirestriction protein ArdC
VHSTGAEHRLKRDIRNTFGCQEYAREELVAEIGAAMLATMLGIRVEWEQHGAYVASWLRVLKDDRKLITQAATQAQKAANHIMNGSEEQE